MAVGSVYYTSVWLSLEKLRVRVRLRHDRRRVGNPARREDRNQPMRILFRGYPIGMGGMGAAKLLPPTLSKEGVDCVVARKTVPGPHCDLT